MGKLVRAWSLVDQVLGTYLAGRLKRGLPIDIAACNGQIYRIDPKSQKLVNLTTQEAYCVHPIDGNNYCFPDMVIVWWDYLHLKPEQIEKVVGPPGSSHRSPWFDGDTVFGQMVLPRNFETEGNSNRNIETAVPSLIAKLSTNPAEVLAALPPHQRRIFDTAYSTVFDYYSRGLLSFRKEHLEVEENVAEDTEGEVASSIEEDIER